MAGNGGGLGGAPGEGMPNHPHPQGTEYTLQGTDSAEEKDSLLNCASIVFLVLIFVARGNALPSNRMASSRARSQRLGD